MAAMLSYPFDSVRKPLARLLRETPQPLGAELLLRVGRCSLCHNDVNLPAEMGEMMALACRGTMPTLPLSTRPMAEVNQALQNLRSGAIRGGAVLQP
jgi:D-arabinose 1-dehydrogenase-like Zn-dependent alcohol dehydrogenase